MMKRKLKAALLILLGMFIGAVVAGISISVYFAGIYNELYYTEVLSHANAIYMIRAGEQEELVRTTEQNLTMCIPQAENSGTQAASRLPALWLMKDYYERFDLPVPAELKPILDGLPPRPPSSCQLRAMEAEARKAATQSRESNAPADE